MRGGNVELSARFAVDCAGRVVCIAEELADDDGLAWVALRNADDWLREGSCRDGKKCIAAADAVRVRLAELEQKAGWQRSLAGRYAMQACAEAGDCMVMEKFAWVALEAATSAALAVSAQGGAVGEIEWQWQLSHLMALLWPELSVAMREVAATLMRETGCSANEARSLCARLLPAAG